MACDTTTDFDDKLRYIKKNTILSINKELQPSMRSDYNICEELSHEIIFEHSNIMKDVMYDGMRDVVLRGNGLEEYGRPQHIKSSGEFINVEVENLLAAWEIPKANYETRQELIHLLKRVRDKGKIQTYMSNDFRNYKDYKSLSDFVLDITKEYDSKENVVKERMKEYIPPNSEEGDVGSDERGEYVLFADDNRRLYKEYFKMFGRIGAAFIGEEYFIPCDTENYYMPKNPACFKDMYFYIRRNNPEYIKLDTPSTNFCKSNTCHSKTLSKYIDLPISYLTDYKEKQNSRRYDIHQDLSTPRILCLYLNEGLWHCVFWKGDNIIRPYLEFEITNINSIENSSLEIQVPMDSFSMKERKAETHFVYDYETVTQSEDGKPIEHKPIIVTVTWVDLDGDYDKEMIALKDRSKSFYGYDCTEQMLSWIISFPGRRVMWAFNGSTYDSKLIMYNENIKIKKEITSGGKTKSLVFSYSDELIEARDLKCFLGPGFSLKVACNSFGNKYYKKLDLEIHMYPKLSDYEANKDSILEYAIYDTLALGELMYNVNKMFERESYLSIRDYLGIPGLAFNCMKNHIITENVLVPKDENIRKFQRQSMYGGRMIHHHKLMRDCDREEGLICMDANSLYPSAMTYDYPVGRCSFIPSTDLDPTILLDKYTWFIADVTLHGNNQKHGIIPYKEGKSSGLLYPTGLFRGVYTSVEIKEAINNGYSLLEVHQGIYWKKGLPIFKEYIEKYYNKRNELKAKKDPAQQIVKDILNSTFGKFLESVDEKIQYFDEELHKDRPKVYIRKDRMKNGQYRYTSRIHPTTRRPSYIGAFILSYARGIMNKLFEHIDLDDVYYGDTDSIYIPKRLEKYIPTGDGLCEFKNDYGDASVVIDCIFMDYKKYLLKIKQSDGSIIEKHKCVGINFSSKSVESNIIYYKKDMRKTENEDEYINGVKEKKFTYDEVKQALENEYSVINVIQEKWCRQPGNSIIVDVIEMGYSLRQNPNRYNWYHDVNQRSIIGNSILHKTSSTAIEWDRVKGNTVNRIYPLIRTEDELFVMKYTKEGQNYLICKKPLSHWKIKMRGIGKSNIWENKINGELYKSIKNYNKITFYRIDENGLCTSFLISLKYNSLDYISFTDWLYNVIRIPNGYPLSKEQSPIVGYACYNEQTFNELQSKSNSLPTEYKEINWAEMISNNLLSEYMENSIKKNNELKMVDSIDKKKISSNSSMEKAKNKLNKSIELLTKKYELSISNPKNKSRMRSITETYEKNIEKLKNTFLSKYNELEDELSECDSEDD